MKGNQPLTSLGDTTMNALHIYRNQSPENDLARVIEPLASYICAAERPRAALASALKVLLHEVQQTNQAALAHCGSFAQSAA
jgi:hypothetical protein